MSYLQGISHRFISEDECVIVAERQWKYILFEFSKEVEYTAKFKEIFKGYNQFNFFKNGIPVNGYEKYCLEMYSHKILIDNSNLKKYIRKRKLDKLKKCE